MLGLICLYVIQHSSEWSRCDSRWRDSMDTEFPSSNMGRFNSILDVLPLHIFIFKDKNETCGKRLLNALYHLPMVVPAYNCYHLYKMYEITYPMDVASLVEKEKLQKKAGQMTFIEAYLESGPQLLTQFHVITCTGHYGRSVQHISMLISFFSLSLAATRTFFIQRDPRNADPDPSPHMVIRVLPLMMIVLSYNILSWTFILGILKAWTILALIFIFLCNLTAHKVIDKLLDLKKTRAATKGNPTEPRARLSNNKTLNSHDNEEIREVKVMLSQEKITTLEQAEKTHSIGIEQYYFSLQASILALWVPAIVGKRKYTFLVMAISSFVSRSVLFLLSFLLAELKLGAENAFLFYCITAPESVQYVIPCYNMTQCFHSSTEVEGQKVRICPDDHADKVIPILAGIVMFTGLCSGLSLFQLSRFSDYTHLFKASKSCCFLMCPVLPFMREKQAPIIHRTLVFDVLESWEDQEAADFLKEILSSATDKHGILSRPLNRDTPLTCALSNDKTRCVQILLEKEAAIIENGRGEYPLNIAIKKKNMDNAKILVERGAINMMDAGGEYPLEYFFNNDNQALVKLLIDNSYKYEDKVKSVFDCEGWEIATSKHRTLVFDVLERLEDQKAAEFLQDILSVATDKQRILSRPLNGDTPLTYALSNDKTRCVKILLEKGAPIVQNHLGGEYPLNIAIKKKNMDNAKCILEHGAINMMNAFGEFPLEYFFNNDEQALVKLLIENSYKDKHEDKLDSVRVVDRDAWDLLNKKDWQMASTTEAERNLPEILSQMGRWFIAQLVDGKVVGEGYGGKVEKKEVSEHGLGHVVIVHKCYNLFPLKRCSCGHQIGEF